MGAGCLWRFLCEGGGDEGAGDPTPGAERLCEDIDGKVKAFLDRPLEGDWPYLWIDATYLKVRRGGRIVSVAVSSWASTVTAGARFWADRHVRSRADLDRLPAQAHTARVARGQAGCLGRHEGIKAAGSKVLCATWQRCRVHFMPNVLAHASKSGRRADHCTCSVRCLWRRHPL
ncbi:transposase [Devosia oryzisoli]|uniref:transposase n=1 Tax=Devosia oryzisoli TaxID=2774138 RepID=UPI003D0E7F5D